MCGVRVYYALPHKIIMTDYQLYILINVYVIDLQVRVLTFPTLKVLFLCWGNWVILHILCWICPNSNLLPGLRGHHKAL